LRRTGQRPKAEEQTELLQDRVTPLDLLRLFKVPDSKGNTLLLTQSSESNEGHFVTFTPFRNSF